MIGQVRLSKIELASFFKAYIFGSVIPLVRISTGLIRSKYVAVFLGLTGVGALSQANQMQQLGVTLGSLGLAVGVINRSRSFEGDEDSQNRVFGTSFTVHFLMSSLMLLVGVLFRKELTLSIFGSLDFVDEFLIALFSLPFYAMASGHLEGVLFGLDQYYLYIRGTVFATLLGFLSYFPLVYFYGISGAFLAFSFSGLVLFASFLFYSLQHRTFLQVVSFRFDWDELKILLRFSGVLLLTGCLGYSCLLWMRGRISQELGIDMNGIAHMSMAMTSYYTPFLTNTMWGKFYPSVSRHGDTDASHRQLGTMTQLTVFLCTVMILFVMLLQREIVLLAYTDAFFPALKIIPYQLLGDFFYFIWFLFGVYFMGVSSLRVYLVGWLFFYLGYPALTVYLLDSYQLMALPMGYGLVSFLLALCSLLYLAISGKFADSARTVWVVLGCLTGVILQVWLTLSEFGYLTRAILPLSSSGVLLLYWRAHRTDQ